MKRRKIFLFSIFVFAFLVWSAVGAAEEVVIGYSGSLSGPAAEYVQDNINGIDMAIKELNAAGGITVKGKNNTFKLHQLDDRAGMTEAINNARKFVTQDKAPVVFNSSATTIGSLLEIKETAGNEFLLVGYSSMHAIHNLGNKLLINPTPDYRSFIATACDFAWRVRLS